MFCSAQFDALLSAYGVPHQFLVVPDQGHSWRLWRAEETNALLVASDHVIHARVGG